MEHGILMEVQGRQGILLTGTGEFRRVDLGAGKWQVGEEVSAPLAKTGRPWLRSVVAAAAAFLIMFGGPTGYWQWSLAQPSVVLAMEINPTVEFTINGKGKVIEARGLNADGEVLLQGTDWRDLPVDQVVRTVTDKAVAMGKLDPASAEGAIVVTVAPVKGEALSESKAVEITTTAQAAAQSAVQAAAAAKGMQPQAQVASTPATKSEVEQARAEGLTLPEYLLFKSLKETHPEVKPEDFEKKGPGAVLKELGILPSEVLPSIGKGHGKDDVPGHDRNDDRGGDRGKDDKDEGQNGDKSKGNDKSNGQGNEKSNGQGNDKSNGQGNDKKNGQNNGRGDDKSQSRDNDHKGDDKKGEEQRSSLDGQQLSKDDSTNGGASDNRGGATGARDDDDDDDVAPGKGRQGSDPSQGRGSDASEKGRPDKDDDRAGQGSNSGGREDRPSDDKGGEKGQEKGRDKDKDQDQDKESDGKKSGKDD